MEKQKKTCAVIMAVYILLVVGFYFISGDGFRYGSISTEMLSRTSTTGELLAGQSVIQPFVAECNRIDSVTVFGATYGRANTDVLSFQLLDADGNRLCGGALDTSRCEDNTPWTVVFDAPAEHVKGRLLTLVVTSRSGVGGNAVSLYFGDSMAAGKFEVPVQVEYPMSVSGTQTQYMLCLSVTGTVRYELADFYWYFVSALGLAILIACLRTIRCTKAGKSTLLLRLANAFKKYRFLLKQLVARDFKTKYKRSVLGMLWSFLNPLLTMLVMYIVFSTLFKSSIQNFAVYLLIGIVCWNFFSEATNMCLTSITGNASLITKVYVPKYMYPFSRAVSSLVNLGFSLIPLFLMLIATGTRFTVAYLILPFGIVCLFLLALGMGLLLSASMVFFRDTQFLWSVISLMWMYLTPIFYDSDIIPARFMTLYKMNPLYHIVRLFRIILINGVSPEPKAYLLCLAASLVPLLIGVAVFRKTQDRFVLYL